MNPISNSQKSWPKLPYVSKRQEEELLRDWESMLAHQLGNLAPASEYLVVLPKVVRWVISTRPIEYTELSIV